MHALIQAYLHMCLTNLSSVLRAAAIGCGVGDPFMYSMFGDLIDEIYSAKTGQELGETFQFYGMLFMGLASGILVVALVQMFTFEWVSERQSSSVRTTYLRAILRQDSAYFDSLKHGALELPGSVAIDALALRDGFGFKASQALRGLATFWCVLLVQHSKCLPCKGSLLSHRCLAV